MQNIRNLLKRQKGFTLIELMIVVAIIGILAAIAIPNFLKFQARAKQSEAKSNLKGIYTALRTYYAENTFYAPCGATGTSGFCGWAPDGGNQRYRYVLSAATSGALSSGCADPGTGITDSNSSTPTFTAGASANIDNDTACDVWTITSVLGSPAITGGSNDVDN